MEIECEYARCAGKGKRESSIRLSRKARENLDWVLDHLETIVLLGFVVVVIYAFIGTG
jgi:hypothetical protein